MSLSSWTFLTFKYSVWIFCFLFVIFLLGQLIVSKSEIIVNQNPTMINRIEHYTDMLFFFLSDMTLRMAHSCTTSTTWQTHCRWSTLLTVTVDCLCPVFLTGTTTARSHRMRRTKSWRRALQKFKSDWSSTYPTLKFPSSTRTGSRNWRISLPTAWRRKPLRLESFVFGDGKSKLFEPNWVLGVEQ